jgi:hypothetical protein
MRAARLAGAPHDPAAFVRVTITRNLAGRRALDSYPVVAEAAGKETAVIRAPLA